MARIQTLGLTQPPAELKVQRSAATSTAAAPDMAEYGASGTPIFGGFLRERGEYVPELQGFEAIQVYERMRRSDAQVAATLMAMKLPIRSAEWDVVAGEDASPVEEEAAEFVKDCLFKDLNFTDVLRNALLMLDFGVAAHEDVYQVVDNRVRLKKLAPRLPLTFYRWITDQGGEDLQALEQMGYRGSEYLITQVPMSKLSVFTFEQEGSNFTGRSLLRSMYQHWYIKSGLYKVDSIACERNGMGVPVVTMGKDAKVEDRKAALDWVQKLVAHERTGLVLPPEWLFKLEGVTGTLRDPKESIAHHNMLISMAGLAMFMMLGQSHGGNRALGDTMADFFYLGLDATSDQVARVMNQTTVKRLVDFNFAGVVNYPRLVCQQILTVKFEGIVDALQKLATAGVVEPDANLESWMREKMGAPEVDKATVRAVPAKTGFPGAPTPEGASGAVNAKSGAGSGEAPNKQVASERLALMDVSSVHVPGAMGSLTTGVAGTPEGGSPDFSARLKRAPRGAEKSLALSEIVSALDKGRDDVAAALRAARSRIQAEVVNKLVNAPVRDMHRVSIAGDAKLTAEVETILRRVLEFGAAQVEGERARQMAGRAPADAAKIRAAAKRDPIGMYADGVVSEFTNGLTARAANLAIDYSRRPGDSSKGQIIRDIEQDLDDQSDRWVDGVASKGANEAFADGRQDGYEQYADEIGSVIYSALLDLNTCESCAGADGEEGATPDDIPGVPNPDCDGGDKCRCVHVYVFADEGKVAA
jgi:phage gp29-like protein